MKRVNSSLLDLQVDFKNRAKDNLGLRGPSIKIEMDKWVPVCAVYDYTSGNARYETRIIHRCN